MKDLISDCILCEERALHINGEGNLQGAEVVIPNAALVIPDPVMVEEKVATCFDEDDGLNNYGTRNYVQVSRKRFYDFCQGDYIRESYCDHRENNQYADPIPCEFGCERGACLESNPYTS